MRSSSGAALPLLQLGAPHQAYLLTLTTGGTVYRWTSLDRDVRSRGQVWVRAARGSVPGLAFGRARWALGLEVTTLDLTFHCGSSSMLGGRPFPAAAAAGVLDGAAVLVERALFAEWDHEPAVLHWFEGTVAGIEVGATEVRCEVRSLLERLMVTKLPKRTYQALCPYMLFSPACGATRPAPASRTVLAGSISSVIRFTSTDGFDWWVRGLADSGTEVRHIIVSTYLGFDVHEITVDPPFSVAPGSGSTITLTRGCRKTVDDCDSIWNRKASFGGFPWIPMPERAIKR